MDKRSKGLSQQKDSDALSVVTTGPRAAFNYGPLEEQLGYLLRRAQIAVFRDFFEAFSAFEIRPAQYSVLTVIECNPGLSQTQVCDALGIRKTNFVAMLDELETRGLVRRAITPRDRRFYALFLTDAGQDFIRNLHRTAAEHEQRIINKMGGEAHTRIFEMLETLVSAGDEKAVAAPEPQALSRKPRQKTGATRKASPRRRTPL